MKTETVKTITEAVRSLTPTPGEKWVLLNRDDLINLREMRTDYANALNQSADRSNRDWERILETLERILKQMK